MKKSNYLLLLICVLFTVACNTKSNQKVPTKPNKVGINFTESSSLTSLLNKAEARNQIVFVDMYIDKCPPCEIMDKNVFTHKPLADRFNSKFINYKLNGTTDDNGPTVASIYQVTFYPTLLFLSSDGVVLAKKEGGASITQLNALADEAVANLMAN